MEKTKRYAWRVVYPLPEILAEEGFGKVAHIPFVLNSSLDYNSHGSRFLIDRALCVWPKLARPITSLSIRTYSNALCNWLNWCDVRGIDPLQAEYKTVLQDRYQREMVEGIWSAHGEGLSPITINQRVDVAIEFLEWAADHDLRPDVVIPTETKKRPGRYKATSSEGYQLEAVEVRKGKMRIPKRRIGMPSEEAVGAWLRQIYSKPVVGDVEGLLCETVLETALRKSEVAGLRVDTIPLDTANWVITDRTVAPEHQMLLIDIKFGTKGPEYGSDHGDKIGPLQTILMPWKLAMRLHHYRNTERPNAVITATRKGKTAAEQRRIRDDTVHLFINPKTGERYTPSRVYDAWRSVPLPQPGWTVHQGRDFWACTTLWRAMVQHRKLFEEVLERKLNDATLSLFKNDAMSVIELQIQRQLRHVSRDTSMGYLQWLADRLGVSLNLHQNYVEALGTEGDDEEESD